MQSFKFENSSSADSSLVSTGSGLELWEYRGNFAKKLDVYLQDKGVTRGDVSFFVGPERVEIRAFKLPLVVASEELEKLFETDWSQENIKKTDDVCNGIRLPDLDPEAFKIFLRLVNYDEGPVSWLKEMNLPMELVFGVLHICKKFSITAHIQSLERLVDDFVQQFPDLVHMPEFLHMPSYVLKEFYRNQHLPMNELGIFQSACRWATHQCRDQGLDPTGQNMRNVLGDALFEIRFPLIPTDELAMWVCPTGILTEKEQLSLLIYKGLPPCAREAAETLVPFSVVPRSMKFLNFTFTVNFLENFIVRDYPSFPCSESAKTLCINSDTKISVHGVGFLGPVKCDAVYNVKVQLFCENNKFAQAKTSVMAKKQRVFYVTFPTPIILEKPEDAATYKFGVKYVLQGPPTQSCDLMDFRKSCIFDIKSHKVTFTCDWDQSQVAELSFQLVD